MDKAGKIIIFSFLLQGVCWANWSVSLPEEIEALSGSCVFIKCSFTINQTYEKDLTERAVGVWYKDEHKDNTYIVFDSSKLSNNNKIKGNITETLKEKNCTTIFNDIKSDHSGKYYFRIEGDGVLKYTYKTASVTVNVIESPHNPTVKLYKEQMKVEGEEQVLENSSVSLHCSAKTLCSSPPPTLTWNSTLRPPLSESSRIQEEQNPPEIISDLNFTATHLHHRVTFTCTITYQLQDTNKTAHSNLTLHVQYAPKISLSSSCNTSHVTVCFCEADGNPSPKLEWRLSGRPVTDSTNTSINEERLSSTGLRSSITLHHLLTHTLTLQCVSTNTHGNDTREFTLSPSHFFLLIGAAVGFSLMIILCVITYLTCARRKNKNPTQTRPEATSRCIVTDDENKEESVYAKVMPSSSGATTLNPPESLHYSSIHFKNTKPDSGEIRGVSALTAYYAVVERNFQGVKKSSGGSAVPQSNSVAQFSEAKNEGLLTNSDEAYQLYAQVKC